MPRRRNHTKSIYGCDQCKSRRVKCDETYPACTSCATREEECHYSKSRYLSPTSRTHQSQSSPASSLPLPSTSSTTPRSHTTSPSLINTSNSPTPCHLCSHRQDQDASNGLTRVKERELMHFWYTKTSQSFTADLGELFQNDVVDIALEHDFLYDFIFALTALHIASEKADSDTAAVSKYITIALGYQSTCFTKLRTALNNITEENCNAIFFSSVLAMVCSMVSHFLVRANPEAGALTTSSASSAAGCVLALYHSIDGISSIHNISRRWLERGPYGLLVTRRLGTQVLFCESAVIASAQLRHLNDAINRDRPPNSPLYQVYEGAIQCMESSFEKNLGMTWVNYAGEGFANELLKEEPMALAILMHWGVMLCKIRGMWWAVLLGRRIVEEVSETLAGHGRHFEEVRAWARQEIDTASGLS